MQLETTSHLDFRHIFHPNDGTSAGDLAFAHALKLTLLAQGRLTILHSDAGHATHGKRHALPHVRETLERWGYLTAHSQRGEVAELGIAVEKISVHSDDAVKASLKYLDRHPHDLLVLATHQYDGLERLLHKTVAEPLVRQSGAAALYLPHQCEGFVQVESGAVKLRHVLLPVAQTPSPLAAIRAVRRLAHLLEGESLTCTLLHVGEAAATAPPLHLPLDAGIRWEKVIRHGDVVDVVLATAREVQAELIVMATAGHHGLLDALRGSTTERIVRHADAPVLAVPVATEHAYEFLTDLELAAA